MSYLKLSDFLIDLLLVLALLLFPGVVFYLECLLQPALWLKPLLSSRLPVVREVRLLISALAACSRELFPEAPFFSQIHTFFGCLSGQLRSGPAAQQFQPELQSSFLVRPADLMVSWPCSRSFLFYQSDLFFWALFRVLQLSEPLKIKMKMNSSSFLFGPSSTSQSCFSKSARESTASSRCFSNKETLWWRQSMSSSFWWICSVASWSSSIMSFVIKQFSSAACPSPLQLSLPLKGPRSLQL